MVVVKTRKVGNSMSVTIPKELEVPQGKEFQVFKIGDGTLILSPTENVSSQDMAHNLLREKLLLELGKTIEQNLAEIDAGDYLTIEEMETLLS